MVIHQSHVSSKPVLPNNTTSNRFFKALETETAALFEHLDFTFLVDYPVFAPPPPSRGENTDSQATGTPERLLHCFCHDIYGPRLWHENFTTKTSGDSVDSRVRRTADA